MRKGRTESTQDWQDSTLSSRLRRGGETQRPSIRSGVEQMRGKNDDNSVTQRSIGHDIREFPRGREEKGKSGFSRANTDVPGTNLEENDDNSATQRSIGGGEATATASASERADEREEEGRVRLQQGQHRRPGDERANERTNVPLDRSITEPELWQRNPRVHPVPLRRRPALQTACWGRTNERAGGDSDEEERQRIGRETGAKPRKRSGKKRK